MFNYPEDLLQKAILEIKDGNSKLGRRYLERSERICRDQNLHAKICYWYAKIAESDKERIRLLKDALAYDPVYSKARRELAILLGELDPSEIIDPEAIPAPPITEKRVSASRFVCPQCGARMVYTANGQSLHCEHCGYKQQVTKSITDAKEQDFFVGMAIARGHQSPVAAQVFSCKGCGARFFLPPQTISTTCAYCGSPHVVREEQRKDILLPNGIIPHKFTQKAVTKLFEIWLRKNKVNPESTPQPLRGVYLPVWTFDIIGNIVYYEEVDDNDPNGIELFNHKSTVPRDYYMHFDDLCVPASRRQENLFKKLLPTYDLKEMNDYKPDFLANWGAEVYDIPMADASLDARDLALKEARQKIEIRMPTTAVAGISPGDIQITSFKLVLLPVWFSTFRVSEQEVFIFINGQNGSALTEPPVRKQGVAGWLQRFRDHN